MARLVARATLSLWGTEIIPHMGKVGAEAGKRMMLLLITLRALYLPLYTASFLLRLVSNFIHPLSHRRECLSMLHRVFKYISSLDNASVRRLPADILDELAMCALQLRVYI